MTTTPRPDHHTPRCHPDPQLRGGADGCRDRGTCPNCGRQIALRQNGTLRHHLSDRWYGGWREVCPGKGQPPKGTR